MHQESHALSWEACAFAARGRPGCRGVHLAARPFRMLQRAILYDIYCMRLLKTCVKPGICVGVNNL